MDNNGSIDLLGQSFQEQPTITHYTLNATYVGNKRLPTSDIDAVNQTVDDNLTFADCLDSQRH